MNTAAKRFLLIYFAVYVLVSIGLNAVLGPPGMSADYLAEYKADHDRYLSIIKDKDYKIWKERPALHTPDEQMAAQIAFVDEYSSREPFQSESRRRTLYETLFDFFKVGMVVLLAVRFGRAPAIKFVHAKIAEIRHRIERVEKERDAANEAKLTAERRLEQLAGERAVHQSEMDERIKREKARIAEMTQQGLALIEQETRERQRHEEMLAERELKEGVIDAALAVVTERYTSERSGDGESAMLDRFLNDIGDSR